jgi:hypothetical protein
MSTRIASLTQAKPDSPSNLHADRAAEAFMETRIRVGVYSQAVNIWLLRYSIERLVFELGVPIAIWFNRTRRAALALLFLFHVSLDYSMNLNLFHWIS